MTAGPASKTVEVPGARLYVVDEGAPSDPPIVLVHAGIADLRSWDDLAVRLIDAGYRVVRFDMRGAGRTQSDPGFFSAAAIVDFVTPLPRSS